MGIRLMIIALSTLLVDNTYMPINSLFYLHNNAAVIFFLLQQQRLDVCALSGREVLERRQLITNHSKKAVLQNDTNLHIMSNRSYKVFMFQRSAFSQYFF